MILVMSAAGHHPSCRGLSGGIAPTVGRFSPLEPRWGQAWGVMPIAAVIAAVTVLVSGLPASVPAGALAAPVPTTPAVAVQPLPGNAGVDYQLGGAYEPPPDAGIVVRDRTDPPAPGRYSVCYLNAFQTQPGTLRWWRHRHPDVLLRDREGRLVADPGWPDERLLDPRAAAGRRELVGVVAGWMTGCAQAGYAAVELDNMDSWTRSRGLIPRAAALRYSAALVRAAHARGLAVGQKNDAENTAAHVAAGFDFAVTESCQHWRECDVFMAAYGDAVLEVEYSATAFEAACRARADRWSIVLRDRDLVPVGRPGYQRQAC